MLNKSSKSRQPCFALELRGTCFQLFTDKYDVNCGFVFHSLYYIEISSIYTHLFKSFFFFFTFYHKCWILPNAFLHLLRGSFAFKIFCLLIYCIMLVDLQILRPWNESPLNMICDPFNVHLDLIANILLKILYLFWSEILARNFLFLRSLWFCIRVMLVS